MNSADSLKTIADRLLKENISAVPLDEKSLDLIEQYMTFRLTGSDLMRRLSNIEINYIQIHSDAERACDDAANAKNEIARIFKRMIDGWRTSGVIREFSFSFSGEEIERMRSEFSVAYESIRFNSSIISNSLIVLGETSAQIRACSASFTEVYRESKLAVYAAMLNRDVDNILDCRAISLQAHASSNESNRASAAFLGATRQCTKMISLINAALSEIVYTFRIDENNSSGINITSPAKAVNIISETIRALDSTNLQDK